jgi:sugar phosphate isomerase/epimerase
MKFGVSTLGCPAWSLEDVAERAQEYGYDGVELRLLDGEVITPAAVRANRDRLGRLFVGGPRLITLGTSIRIATPQPDERSRQLRELIEFIELARELGVPAVRVFGGRGAEGESFATTVDRAADFLNRAAEAAETAGVMIALETHDDFSKSEAVAAALAPVPSRSVAALWDVHHPYRMGENVAQAWTNLANRLAEVHVKDAIRRPDGSWQLVELGQGEVPVREIVRALALRGYDGYVVDEWEKKWHPEIPEPEVAFPHDLQKLKEWIADLG